MMFMFALLLLFSSYFTFTVLVKEENDNIIDLFHESYYLISVAIIFIFQNVFLVLILGSNLYIDTFRYAVKGTTSYFSIEVMVFASLLSMIIAIIIGKIVNYGYIETKYKKSYILLINIFVIISSLFILNYTHNGNKNLFISEVCRKKINENINENGELIEDETSYITLHNNSNHDIYFDYLFLSTDEDNLEEKRLEDVYIKANSNLKIEKPCDYLDFSSSKNTVLYVYSDKYKETICTIDVPALENDKSYCFNNELNIYEIKEVTTQKLNIVEEPAFSKPGGFYDESFNLYFDVPTGTRVYYTLDCSDPTEDSLLYSGKPIYIYDRSNEENVYRNIQNVIENYYELFVKPEKVDKCLVVKAIAIDKNNNVSQIVSNSYFVGLNKYKNKNVISITTDPKNLFDSENGIYVTGKTYDEWYKENYSQIESKIDKGELKKRTISERHGSPNKNYSEKGDNSERISNLEIFQNGEQYINQFAGIRIQGLTNRVVQLKNFSIYSRKKYSDNQYFDNDVFDSKTHSFCTRKEYQNAFVNMLIKDRYVTTQNVEKIELFVDGEHWYSGYLYDKYSPKNLSTKYNVTSENIVVNKAGSSSKSIVNEKCSFDQLKNYVSNTDFSDENNYQNLNNLMDIQSYIDFQCINIYLGNTDYHESLNVVRWHTAIKENEEYGDGRWRWALYDNDSAFYNTNGFTYSWNGREGYDLNSQTFYKSLKVNKKFCRDFVNTFMDLENTIFRIENIKNISQYFDEKNKIDTFFTNREEYINKCLCDEYKLSGKKSHVILNTNNSDAGAIILNTIKSDLSKQWEGNYYIDYPITLEIKANKGFNFDHWEVNGNYYSDNTKIEVNLQEGDVSINAIFN